MLPKVGELQPVPKGSFSLLDLEISLFTVNLNWDGQDSSALLDLCLAHCGFRTRSLCMTQFLTMNLCVPKHQCGGQRTVCWGRSLVSVARWLEGFWAILLPATGVLCLQMCADVRPTSGLYLASGDGTQDLVLLPADPACRLTLFHLITLICPLSGVREGTQHDSGVKGQLAGIVLPPVLALTSAHQNWQQAPVPSPLVWHHSPSLNQVS